MSNRPSGLMAWRREIEWGLTLLVVVVSYISLGFRLRNI